MVNTDTHTYTQRGSFFTLSNELQGPPFQTKGKNGAAKGESGREGHFYFVPKGNEND